MTPGGPPTGDGSEPVAPAPTAATLDALPNDAWAWLLPHVRTALRDLDGSEVTPLVQRLRAAPTSRLAGGRIRRDLHGLLARGGPLWQAVVATVRSADGVPAQVAALVDPALEVADGPAPSDDTDGSRTVARRGPGPRERAEERARERLREVRAERDELRRQLDGATARAARAEAARDELTRALDEARAALADRDRALDAAADDRARAVDRERRRREGELRELEATVATLRRAEEERRAEHRRRQQAERQAAERARRDADREVREDRAARQHAATTRLVPGRPSRLPDGVAPGTTEAAELLLPPGRLLLVDGYNVTKQHQPELDLEAQRAWLVRTLAVLAARRRVRPTAVFDGQRAAGSRPPGGSREVTVTFTPSGITADDELVLTVEATDEPVTVVTDDRDLTARLTAAGADVIGTRPFLGATRGT